MKTLKSKNELPFIKYLIIILNNMAIKNVIQGPYEIRKDETKLINVVVEYDPG
jgi:hypothetical protein